MILDLKLSSLQLFLLSLFTVAETLTEAPCPPMQVKGVWCSILHGAAEDFFQRPTRFTDIFVLQFSSLSDPIETAVFC